MQSAYRRFHSTETAVTEVFNDLLVAADGGKTSPLCLLDLTAAFDEVDHQLLLLRLERRGVVLEWFKSYLSGRVVSCTAAICRPLFTYSLLSAAIFCAVRRIL